MHQFTDQENLRPFSSQQLKDLLLALEKRRPVGRAVAAFDADGTLWNTDMGEAFFDYPIKNKLVPLPSDPWGHYTHLKDNVSHPVAYLWLAQILKDVPLSQVRTWAEASVSARPIPFFAEQRVVIEKLKQLSVEVYIVTASITWAVEPAAHQLGLRDDQVIGIETAVIDGVVSDVQKGVITYREGKADAILAKTGHVSPYFSSGNTEGDLWLLEAATELRLVISSAPEGTENFPTESKMINLAKERGWFHHRY